MEVLKNTIAGLVAGALVSATFVGVVELSRSPVEIPEAIKGEQGERGPRGFQGPVGPQGPAGPEGKNGKDGKDATVDLDLLADKVADELEDREDAFSELFDGEEGDYIVSFDLEDGDYKFHFKHFGAGEFVVSLENEDDELTSLVDDEGHVSEKRSFSLDEGDYKLIINADGDWSVKIEE